jgi:hypothetical protein
VELKDRKVEGRLDYWRRRGWMLLQSLEGRNDIWFRFFIITNL